jgi:hypothetical protein
VPEASYSFTLVVGEEAADADGDALPDVWEEEGVDGDGDGDIDLDLPAMGADPLHKDIFRQERVRGSFVYAGRAGVNTFRFRGCVAGRALRPGRYVLVATPLAVDGRPGRVVRVRFRIVH